MEGKENMGFPKAGRFMYFSLDFFQKQNTLLLKEVFKSRSQDKVLVYVFYLGEDLRNIGFPGGSDGKESVYNAGDLGSIPGLGRSPEAGHGNPLQYSCLESPHGQRSLGGYNLWGSKELDTPELLSHST